MRRGPQEKNRVYGKRLAEILIFSALLLGGEALACGYVPAGQWARVQKWAGAFGLDPLLLGALVWTESRFCPSAVGKAGEIGLGQVLPSTAAGLGVRPEWLWDPDWNLYASARYLRQLYLAFGRWDLALMAYNAGPGAVRRGAVPASSVAYARKVLGVYAYWRGVGGGQAAARPAGGPSSR